MKNTRKLIPAIAMLLVSAVMMSTASFAWFTMSKEVAAKTMQVNVVGPDNLVISSTETGTYGIVATADEVTAPDLKPVSTITGDDDTFFAVKDNEYLADGYKSTDTTKFVAVTGETKAGYYADYDFWISKQFLTDSVLSVKVLATSTNGLDDGTNITTGFVNQEGKTLTSMRFAVLDAAGTSVGVWNGTSDAYQTTGKAIESLVAESGDTKDTKVLGDVDTLTVGTDEVASVPATAVGSTDAQKVTIRVWCEGESNTNKADFIANTKNITLNVVFGY